MSFYNPDVSVFIHHLTEDYTYKATDCTIGFMYANAWRITSIIYPRVYSNDNEFHDIKNMERILEEMIHLCLPSPDSYAFGYIVRYKDHYLWKHCLHDLLKKKR